MENQFLIVAENITFKNNKLSCINIYDQFLAVNLPAEFVFDMVIVCGPGWEKGEYELAMMAKTNVSEEIEIGKIKIEVPNDKFVYNAIAPNIKFTFGNDINEITFNIYKNENMVLQRTYPVNSLLVPAEKEEANA